MSETIVVTGDSRGVGAAITDKLLKKGYEVVGISRSKSESIKNHLSEYPNQYESLDFDLSDVESIRDFYSNELKKRGPIYGLVNNAGIAYDDLVTNADQERLRKMFEVNVFASVFLSKFAIRDMLLHRTEGAIVHVSSISTMTGYSGLGMYAASKAALEGLSLSIAREWGERGIRSNCIVPGFMETQMTAQLGEEQRDRIYKRTALQQPTDLESVAGLAAYLLSDKARSITGENIRVDSGTF